MGILLQDTVDYFPLTVRDAILQGRFAHQSLWEFESAGDRARLAEIAHLLDLSALLPRVVTSLSGGERRRVSLATLLMQDPGIYLLDEPTNHLDLAYQIRILKLFHAPDFRPHHICLMVMHDINLACRFCDHVLLMFEDGQWQCGPTRTLLTAERLGALYGHRFRTLSGEDGMLFVAE